MCAVRTSAEWDEQAQAHLPRWSLLGCVKEACPGLGVGVRTASRRGCCGVCGQDTRSQVFSGSAGVGPAARIRKRWKQAECWASGPGPCRSPARGCKLTVTTVPFSPPGHTSCRLLLLAPPPRHLHRWPEVQPSFHVCPTPGPALSLAPLTPALVSLYWGPRACPSLSPSWPSLGFASHLGASCFWSHCHLSPLGQAGDLVVSFLQMPALPRDNARLAPRSSPHLEPGPSPAGPQQVPWRPCLSMWS